MPTPPPIEKSMGMRFYQTFTNGIGGRVRLKYKDFLVKEILWGVEASSIHRCTNNYVCCNKYFVYILEKKGLDTFEALEIVKRKVGAKGKIGYAGLKDANAVTYQFISFRSYREKLPCIIALNNNVKLFFYRCHDHHISLGENWGNSFYLVIRDVKEEKCYNALESVLHEISSMGGLYPYFGHQRFGTIRPNTHKIGEKIVKRDWFGAVLELVGNPHPKEAPQVYEARKVFEKTLNPKEALELFPRKFVYERIVLKELLKGRSYLEALHALPKRILKIYVEAYQAYIFNEYVSKRLENDIPPNVAIEGDTVFSKGYYEKIVQKRKLRCKENILLPLVGYATKLGKQLAHTMLREVIDKENISLSMFKIKELNMRIKGGLRKSPMIMHGLSYVCSESNLRIHFCLEKGMYATVFLREIMKNEYVS